MWTDQSINKRKSWKGQKSQKQKVIFRVLLLCFINSLIHSLPSFTLPVFSPHPTMWSFPLSLSTYTYTYLACLYARASTPEDLCASPLPLSEIFSHVYMCCCAYLFKHWAFQKNKVMTAHFGFLLVIQWDLWRRRWWRVVQSLSSFLPSPFASA